MSKNVDWKEITHAFEDGLFKTLGLMGVAYCMGSSKPSLNFNFKNTAIITGSIMTFDMVYDYGVKQKWWPPFTKTKNG